MNDLPRFYFNIRRNGVLIRDEEGDALPHLLAALALAQDILRDMLRLPHTYGEPREWQDRTFVITDEAGTALAEMPYASVLDWEDLPSNDPISRSYAASAGP